MTRTLQEIEVLLQRAQHHRPRNRDELARYVEAFCGLKIPSQRLCPNHDSPLDYLAASFLGGLDESVPCRDLVVWANRGGGKTQLGAIASLLECIFLTNCQVRILGGSQEQSRRMYEYIQRDAQGRFSDHVAGKVRSESCQFKTDSGVQILTQSQSNVRGHHVQRLRCDEVELFDPEVWQAAQFIVQSKGGIPGRLEVLSTMHLPFGLMSQIVEKANSNRMRVFRWCLWEVIEKCRDRECSQCPLWEDCRGRAKKADGYYRIDDAIGQKLRSSRHAWQAEMLCQRPYRNDAVFDEFDAAIHVRPIAYNANLPTYRAIDFGFSNPLACLLIQVKRPSTPDGLAHVFVLDEHQKNRLPLARHAAEIKARWPWPIEATYCDPAGRQRNDITGTSAVSELAGLGIPTQSRPSRILEGIELIRNFLAPASGTPHLTLSPQCVNLIRAFESLHYGRESQGRLSELPEKDGVNDHVIDALRYFFVNCFANPSVLQKTTY